MHPAVSIYSVSLVSLCENKDSYSTFLPLLPLSLSPVSLTLSLREGERGRLHRAWQQCFVECELEMWNKDTGHPWKQRARPDEGACLFSTDVHAAATLRWDLSHLHFEVLLLKRLIVKFYWLNVEIFRQAWFHIKDLCTFRNKRGIWGTHPHLLLNWVFSIPGAVCVWWSLCLCVLLNISIHFLPSFARLLRFVQWGAWQPGHWWAQHQPPAVFVHVHVCVCVLWLFVHGLHSDFACVCHAYPLAERWLRWKQQLNWTSPAILFPFCLSDSSANNKQKVLLISECFPIRRRLLGSDNSRKTW